MANIHEFEEIFRQNVQITNVERKYLKVSALNIFINPEYLEMIIDLWIDYLIENKIEFDSILGLPDAGSRFSGALGLEYYKKMRSLTGNGKANGNGLGIHPAKKNAQPTSWADVVTYDANSFTTDGKKTSAYVGEVKKGSKVLLVDDVVAKGDTAVEAITALQAMGVVVVGLLVIFDKEEQDGVERVERETGVKVYSLVTVESVSEEGIKLKQN